MRNIRARTAEKKDPQNGRRKKEDQIKAIRRRGCLGGPKTESVRGLLSIRARGYGEGSHSRKKKK